MGPNIGVIGDSSESFISTEPKRIMMSLGSLFANVGSPLERVASAAPTGMVLKFDERSSIEGGVTSGIPEGERNFSVYSYLVEGKTHCSQYGAFSSSKCRTRRSN